MRTPLACSQRWARDLTQEPRDAATREREAGIVAAREADEKQAETAQREGVTERIIRNIENRKERQPSVVTDAPEPTQSPSPSRPPPLPEAPLPVLKPEHIAVLKALDRPTLTVWLDAIYALEKIIEAMNATRGFGVPHRAMPRLRALMDESAGNPNNFKLEPGRDAEPQACVYQSSR